MLVGAGGVVSLLVQWLRLYSQCRWPEFHPWSGNWIPDTATEDAACLTGDLRTHVLQLRPSTAKLKKRKAMLGARIQ